VNGEIESLGLLVEESRVNYALRSEEFNLSPNSAINASISPNATIAPDGTLTADKLVEDNISSIYKRVQQGGFTVSGDYTVSFFVKEAGRYRGYIQLLGTTNASVSFNLQDGTASGIVPSRTKIEPYPNGWYRVSTSNTFNAGETPTVYIVMLSDSGQSTYTGDGSSGLYIWGLQVEPGAFPTSYIPTSGSTATRNPDNVSMVGENFSSWYNQSEGTFYSNTFSPVDSISGIFNHDYTLHDGSSSEVIRLVSSGSYGSSGHNITIADNSSAQFNVSPIGSKSIFNKVALAYKENDSAVSANVGLATTDTCTIPTPNILSLGGSHAVGNTRSTYIRQFIYYPRRLTNDQLQNLTK
jgi:hypothetical protein